MSDLRGTYEEHGWSEILTGVYYDLLQYLYIRNLKEVSREAGGKKRDQQQAIQALFRAADQTANVMLRAIDYCPPVDLRYDEYARALLRADEVAYPDDSYGIRSELKRIFRRRGLKPMQEDRRVRRDIVHALREAKTSKRSPPRRPTPIGSSTNSASSSRFPSTPTSPLFPSITPRSAREAATGRPKRG
ncbi:MULTISPECIES: hypothetical protein [unclassified Bradyrhizobium]|uniref:hypothetical protein n=1 Tax=unclassified Bradyrhizobium TaxID=2631580 RepID=UPI001BCE1F91|nr:MULTISPECIES: hypothetical protein [unclassified Bradyrhizobium]WOH52129.1 hypothetical protein RX328_07620 [Bradyrhizobium sp. sBnM-33]